MHLFRAAGRAGTECSELAFALSVAASTRTARIPLPKARAAPADLATASPSTTAFARRRGIGNVPGNGPKAPGPMTASRSRHDGHAVVL